MEVAYATTGVQLLHTIARPVVTLDNVDIHDSSLNGITLSRTRTDQVIIRASHIHDNAGHGMALSAGSSGCNSRFTGATITGNLIEDNQGDGIYLRGSGSSFFYCRPSKTGSVGGEISGNVIRGNTNGVEGSASARSPGNNGSVYTLIRNNLIIDNRANGLLFTASTSSKARLSPQIVNNTITGNAGNALKYSKPFIVQNNIALGNGAGFEFTGTDVPSDEVSNNLLMNNTGGDWIGFPATFGAITTVNANGTPADEFFNISIDPKFIAADDYHVSLTSPVVNAGVSSSDAPQNDFDGDTRVGNPDIGFDEVPSLSLDISHSLIGEGDGDQAAVDTATRNSADQSEEVVVLLTNSDETVVDIPSTVTIPAGSASVQFDVGAVDNGAIEAPQTVVFTSTANGHVAASEVSIVVEDDEILPAMELGEEFLVNTTISRGQHSTAVATASEGSFVVVWVSPDSGIIENIYAQRFDAEGGPVGSEFRVNADVIGGHRQPDVAMNATGAFVVVWRSSGQDADGTSNVYAQRFDNIGTRVGNEFRVNATTGLSETLPKVSMNDDGNFVVVWTQTFRPRNIGGQRFDSSGQRVGSEFSIDGAAGSAADVAIDENSGFVVVWQGRVSDNGPYAIIAQLYTPDGLPRDGTSRIIVSTNPSAGNPVVAVDDDGDFVVAWQDEGANDDDTGIFGQRFDRNGGRLGETFRASLVTPGTRTIQPAVVVDDEGGFTIAWWKFRANDVFLQQFSPLGRPRGPERQVNTTSDGSQAAPDMAMAPNGDFVVTWQGSGVGDDGGVFGRLYKQPHPTLAIAIDRDTVTEGDGAGAATVTISRSEVNITAGCASPAIFVVSVFGPSGPESESKRTLT